MKKLLLLFMLSFVIANPAMYGRMYGQTYCENTTIDLESNLGSFTRPSAPPVGGEIYSYVISACSATHNGATITLNLNTVSNYKAFNPKTYFILTFGPDGLADIDMSFIVTPYWWNGSSWEEQAYDNESGAGMLEIEKTPTATLTLPFTLLCSNIPVTLTGGSPSGGSYSGSGVTGGILNPGSYSIIYTYDDGVCPKTVSPTASFTVIAAPVVGITSAPANICVDHNPVTLSGSPAAGTFSGPGISGTTFSPSVAQAGSKTITYSYTDGNNCTSNTSTTINVISLPVISFPGMASVCIDKAAFQLTAASGTPTGGTGVYSGTGVSGGITFSPNTAGVGPQTVKYTYTDRDGCASSATSTLTVNALPIPTLTVVPAKICVNGSPVLLGGGLPSGGTYSGTGVTSNNFNPAITGSGSKSITYTYTDGNSCTNSVTKTIDVKALTTLTLDTARACLNIPAVSLPITMKATPSGGTYTGLGVTPATGSFSPPDAGAGLKTITYTYTDANQCTSTITNTIRVLSPLVTFDQIPPVCKDANAFTLTGGSPAGGIYSAVSGSGVTNGVFNPAGLVGAQTLSYTYTDSKTGCINAANTVLTIYDAGKPAWPEFAVDPQYIMCKGSEQTLTLKNGDTYSIQWLSGGTSAGGDKSYKIAGIMQDVPLTVKYTDGNKCINERSFTIGIDNIKADFIARTTIVKKGDSVNFTNASINSSKWIWTVGTEHYTTQNIGIYFNDIGKQTIKLVSISNINCKDSLTITNYITVTATGVSGVKNAESDQLVVYPNPFNDIVNVDLTDRNEDVIISIVNLAGVKVIEKQFKKANGIVTIGASGLPSGTYLMVLTMEGKVYTVKLEKS